MFQNVLVNVYNLLLCAEWLERNFECVHTIPANPQNGENVADRPPVHTKMAIFCRQILKKVDFETSSCEHWKMMKQNIFQRFLNETYRFLGCRYISLASKSWNEFFTVIFRTVFKLFRHRLNASSNFATVTFFTVFKMCRHCVHVVFSCFAIALLLDFHKSSIFSRLQRILCFN